jgi:hypothetical protein
MAKTKCGGKGKEKEVKESSSELVCIMILINIIIYDILKKHMVLGGWSHKDVNWTNCGEGI